MVNIVATGSQVCGLAWSHTVNELLSTHGYAQNQIHLWNAPSLQVTTSLVGHAGRVLLLAMSPDGQSAATGAGKSSMVCVISRQTSYGFFALQHTCVVYEHCLSRHACQH